MQLPQYFVCEKPLHFTFVICGCVFHGFTSRQRLRTVKNNHLEIIPLQTLLFTEQDDTMLTM